MSHTPEMDRLKARLFSGDRRISNFSVSWGDKAHEATVEQRAHEINRALDEAEMKISTGELKDTPPRSQRKKIRL